jgi:transcriptional regulator with XRE-family HTH domain
MALPPQPPAQEAARKRLADAGALGAEEHLLALREAMGLSQNKLAEILGTQGPILHAWEKGIPGPEGRRRKRPTGPSPHKIEAWSRTVVHLLELPEKAVLPATKWLDPADLAEIEALAGPTEASP